MRHCLPFLVLCSGLPLLSQCSDAGVCALSHGPGPLQNRLSLVGQSGRSGSPDNLSFQGARLEGRFRLGTQTFLAASLPYGRVSGPLGSNTGLGDAILVVERSLVESAWGRFSAQLGARLATGEDDAKGLPQRYQLGLGSTDPLVGIRLDGNLWEAGLGYQRATRRSGNTLEPLRRADDLLLHASIRGSLWNMPVNLQALAIQRTGTSDLRRPDGTVVPLPDSDRLQVNLVGGVSLPLSPRWSMEGRLALPLLKRPDNTDGLKRAMSIDWGISYRF